MKSLNAIKTVLLVIVITSLICLQVPVVLNAAKTHKSVKYIESTVRNASMALSFTPKPKEKTVQVSLDEDIFKQAIWEPAPHRDWTKLPRTPPARMDQFRVDGFVYATMFCSRDYRSRDPYLAATQQLIWRLLWSEWAGRHPMVVFVCPFIKKEVRQMFQAQGAWVEEIPLVNVKIKGKLQFARWQDQFAKLNLWSFTQFKRIVYLDSDAFPIQSLEDIFDIVKVQECDHEALEPLDRASFIRGDQEKCDYVFAGVAEHDPFLEGGTSGTNGGVLVLRPDKRMHLRLIRNAKRTDEYDQGYMEQSLFSSKLGFGVKSAFPVQILPGEWNFGSRQIPRLSPAINSTLIDTAWNATEALALMETDEKTFISVDEVRIIHDKMWSPWSFVNYKTFAPYWKNMWSKDWMTMCRLYENPMFDLWRSVGRFPTYYETQKWNLENSALYELD